LFESSTVIVRSFEPHLALMNENRTAVGLFRENAKNRNFQEVGNKVRDA
jgi:hypothetical protein